MGTREEEVVRRDDYSQVTSLERRNYTIRQGGKEQRRKAEQGRREGGKEGRRDERKEGREKDALFSFSLFFSSRCSPTRRRVLERMRWQALALA